MMKITEETKKEIRIENVVPMNPQIVRVLDSNGLCVAFICIGADSCTVQVGLCQDKNFELELDKD